MSDEIAIYKQLALALYRDVAADCSISSKTIVKDLETLNKRIDAEGLSFLTKTLPQLGKDLDKALASEMPFQTVSSFAKSDAAHGRPKFLGAFWDIIFDGDNRVRDYWGELQLKTLEKYPVTDGDEHKFVTYYDAVREHDNTRGRVERQAKAVRAVRQICYLLYKLEGAHSKESEKAVLTQFVETDRNLPQRGAEQSLSSETLRALRNARDILHRVLCKVDLHDIVPGHGPGSVATGERPWEKMNFSRLYEGLEEEYPFTDFFFYNYTHLCDELESLERLTPLRHGVAKVALVPKDSRGPRIISMEPLELQWIQQGQYDYLKKHLERHAPTRGFVNFTSQEINRTLALVSSTRQERLVTVDMKEASDRVSCWLLDLLYPEHIMRCLYASRSKETCLPTGELLELKKFAPMGSAVCFPIEALTFWALAVGSIWHMPSHGGFTSMPRVYVYGDDLILEPDHFEAIRPIFRELFLEFNEDKCCTGRFFRESCGMDAFNGTPVSPVRIKARLDNLALSPAALLAAVSYSNSLHSRGFVCAASELRAHITKQFGYIPTLNCADKISLAFVNESLGDEEVERRLLCSLKSRYNKRYQRTEVQISNFIPPTKFSGEPGWSEMLRLRRLGSSQDPFGFSTRASTPCRYEMPRILKRKPQRVWVGLKDLLKGN